MAGAPRVVPAGDEAVAEAARLLGQGGLVVVPTHTNYNLVCDPEDAAAIRRVFAVKERTKFGPLPLGIADPAAVDRYADGGPAWGARSPSPHRSATVVDATAAPMRLVRPGVVPLGTLQEAIPDLRDANARAPRGGRR